MKPRVGQKINLTIQRLGINGEGVGYWHGYTLFVEGALPGEVLSARITEARKSFGRARVEERKVSSEQRITPPCPLFGRCGGCQLMHLEYRKQLEAKRERVKDALERIGKFESPCVLECIPSPSELAYRNKIQLPVSQNNRLGLYAYNSHELIEIDTCLIHCSLGETIFQQIQKIIAKAHVPLKHVLIKTAVFTEQALVILVTEGKCPELADVALEIMTIPSVKGVIQNINPEQNNIILGEEFYTLAGAAAIEEKLCGLFFKVSPSSFFQVNPQQAERLYEQVVQLADLKGTETVLDAYCGVGTLSLILARHAKEVRGVECVPEAVRDAQENAQRNGITNVSFVCAPAEELALDPVDIAILNPPRKGCEMAFLKRLLEIKPKKIIYISCDPATLARDLAILCPGTYQLDKVQPYDMFPQTAHVETVCLLNAP